MSIKLVTPPATSPVTLAEAKTHLRVDFTDDDTYINALIISATQSAEHMLGRALIQQSYQLGLPEFSDYIEIPNPPLISITSIVYIDTDGNTQTLTSYALDSYSEPAIIKPTFGNDFPSTREQDNAVIISFNAGYADAASVPQEIKSWILLKVGYLYKSRESDATIVKQGETFYADRLLDRYRLRSI
jgi:uncharacterized phiE125 gp8 family phage protein